MFVGGKRLLSGVPGAGLDSAQWLAESRPEGTETTADAGQDSRAHLDDAEFVAIDDAHYLDVASAQAVAAAAKEGRATVLATVLAGATLPAPFRTLLRQGRAEIVDIPLLNRDEIRTAAMEILGAPAGEEILELLTRWSAGRPHWLVAALEWLVDSEYITESATGKDLSRTPSVSDIPAAELPLGFLSDLDEKTKFLVDLLAQGGPKKLEQATTQFAPGSIKTLLAMQIVTLGPPPGRESLGEPAELELQIDGDMLAMALRERPRRSNTVRLGSGDREIAQRARRLYLGGDFSRAAELETHLKDHHEIHEVRSVKLLMQALTSRWNEAESTLESLGTDARGRTDKGHGYLKHSNSGGQGLSSDATEFPGASPSIFDVGMQEAAQLSVGTQSARGLLESAHSHRIRGELNAAREEAEWVVAIGSNGDSPGHSWSVFLGQTSILAVDLLRADGASASTLVANNNLRGEYGQRTDQGTALACRALTLMFQGFHADCVSDARRAVEILGTFDPFAVTPLAASAGLYSVSHLRNTATEHGLEEAREGHAQDADQFVAALQTDWWRSPTFPYLDLVLGVLTAIDALGGTEEIGALDALGAMSSTTTDGTDRANFAKLHNLQEMTYTPLTGALTEALRGGVKTKAADLQTLAPGEASWPDTLMRYKRQLKAARGLTAILDIADDAASRNLLRVQRMAHELALARGYDAPAIKAARDRVSQIEHQGISALAEASEDIHHDTLTAREREIAVLAAKNYTAASIATRLGVSVRTVEGHLQRAYQKLGVHTRTHLARALDATTITFGSHVTETKLTPDSSDPLEYAPRLLGNTT